MQRWEYCDLISSGVNHYGPDGHRFEEFVPASEFSGHDGEYMRKAAQRLRRMYAQRLAKLGLEGWEAYAVNDRHIWFKRPL